MSLGTFQEPYESAFSLGLMEKTSKTLRGVLLAGTVVSSASSYGQMPKMGSIPDSYSYGYYEAESDSISINEKSAMEALKAYTYDKHEASSILSYLVTVPEALTFISGIKAVLNKVFPSSQNFKSLNIVEDSEIQYTLLELTVQTGVPIDDDFMHKHQELSEEIKKSDLVEGLKHVIITLV